MSNFNFITQHWEDNKTFNHHLWLHINGGKSFLLLNINCHCSKKNNNKLVTAQLPLTILKENLTKDMHSYVRLRSIISTNEVAVYF